MAYRRPLGTPGTYGSPSPPGVGAPGQYGAPGSGYPVDDNGKSKATPRAMGRLPHTHGFTPASGYHHSNASSFGSSSTVGGQAPDASKSKPVTRRRSSMDARKQTKEWVRRNYSNLLLYFGLIVGVFFFYHLMSDGDFSFLLVSVILPLNTVSPSFGGLRPTPSPTHPSPRTHVRTHRSFFSRKVCNLTHTRPCLQSRNAPFCRPLAPSSARSPSASLPGRLSLENQSQVCHSKCLSSTQLSSYVASAPSYFTRATFHSINRGTIFIVAWKFYRFSSARRCVRS